jgi:hypothetical protein
MPASPCGACRPAISDGEVPHALLPLGPPPVHVPTCCTTASLLQKRRATCSIISDVSNMGDGHTICDKVIAKHGQQRPPHVSIDHLSSSPV